ncbi:MAG: hypothetical protein IPJ76_14815 [Flavobacteriales bacterium]|nr:MAG: hypothetical protein IPJ76_14815 [Flavobacteriales bacterium]
MRAQVWEPLGGPLAVEVWEVKVNSIDMVFFITEKGLFRSLDNGNTWELLDNGLPTTGLSDLLVAPNDHVFLFGPGNLLYKSVDDGLSWTVLNNGQTFFGGQCLAANALGALFMGMNGMQIKRSYDDGDTWISTAIPAMGVDVIAIGQGDTLYAAEDASPFTGSALRSVDGGNSWAGLNYGLPSVNTHSLFVNALGHVFAGISQGSRFIRSMDGGMTWVELDIGPTFIVSSIVSTSNGDLYIGSHYGGVLLSTDNGDTWTKVNDGMNALAIQLVVNSSDHLFAASGVDLFRSTNGGLSWNGLNDTFVLSKIGGLLANSSNHYFAIAGWGGLYRSLDAGVSWQAVVNGLQGTLIRDIAENSSSDLFVSTGYGAPYMGIYRSMDNGNSWDLVTDTGSMMVNSLAVSSNGHVFGGVDWPAGITKSEDNGNTWFTAFEGVNPCYTFDEMAIGTNGRVFAGVAGCGNKVYTSDDSGTTWVARSISSEIGGAWIRSLSTRPDSTVLAMRSMTAAPRVFRSRNNGLTWQSATFGFLIP